jgi:putative ABC transport system permease protein
VKFRIDSRTLAMGGFALDCRVAARGLWKARGFAVVVVATLALGIGASAAMFSVLHASLFRPPPFRDPDRLVLLSQQQRDVGRPGGFSPRELELVGGIASSFEGIAAYTAPYLNVTGRDEAERVEGEVVSAGYFRVLGVAPAVGRGFAASEDSIPGIAPVVVLGDALWRRRFGADRNIVGTHVLVNRTPLLVVGVMPAGFHGLSGRGDLWIPRAMAATVAFPFRTYSAVARLRPGRTVAQARAEMGLLAPRLAALADAEAPVAGRTATATPLADVRVDASHRRAVSILFGAVGVLLLITCANTTNLLLVRGASREREVAVRLAIGSSYWRLVRFLFAESLLLAMAGGMGALLVAFWVIKIVSPLIPARAVSGGALGAVGDFSIPRLDLPVLAFALVIGLITAIVVGLAPAVRAARTAPGEALKSAGRSATPARRHALGLDVFGVLTVTEIALALVLLVGSGLLLRTLWRLESLPLGFDSAGVITFQVQAPLSWYAPRAAPVLVERLVDRVAGVAGVESAAATYYTPFDPGARHTVRLAAGRDAPRRQVGHHQVTPDYFRTLRIPLLRGRPFTSADRLDRPLVAVLSAGAARRLWPGEDPLGKRFSFETSAGSADSVVEVVGVVGDVRYRPSSYVAEPDVYTPYYQFASIAYALVIVRSPITLGSLNGPLRAAGAEVDPDLPLAELQTMEDRGGRQLERQRLNALLLTMFAALGLAIATVGVYGVVSHLGARRTREFGIRVALGATAADVMRLVLARALVLIGAGIGLGVLGALALTRLLSTQLFDVSPTDPVSFIAFAALLASAALAASYFPARRATKVEPLTAMRAE